jgi:hypothetical protein
MKINDPMLFEVVKLTIEAMVNHYEAAWTPQTGDAMLAPQSIIVIMPNKTGGKLRFDLMPRPMVAFLFSSSANKNLIAPMIDEMLGQRPPLFEGANLGSFEIMAVLVASETWQASMEPNTDIDLDGPVRDKPGAQTAMMVTAYTLDGQMMWSQHMKDGKRDGEIRPMDMKGATGRLVRRASNEPA